MTEEIYQHNFVVLTTSMNMCHEAMRVVHTRLNIQVYMVAGRHVHVMIGTAVP